MSERAREVQEALETVRQRVSAASTAAGRPDGEVTLIAVSKTWPAEDIRHAYAAGQRDFGENYAQELAAKRKELADLVDLRWHFIGALQSNKAKLVVPGCVLVHAVDRPSVAEALAKRARAAGLVADALVEVNVSEEESKGGVALADAESLIDALSAQDGLRITGLMCIPAPGAAPDDSRPAFRRLRELRDRLQSKHPALSLLSMGMSGDFEAAIGEGATHVRVGSAIFGSRPRK